MGRDQRLKVQHTVLMAAGLLGSTPRAREIFSRRSMAGPGAYPKRGLAPEPPGQSRNEAVSIGLVVEDVG
jgi:hypothetical protein